VGEEETRFPSHAAFVAARSPWLRTQLLRARERSSQRPIEDRQQNQVKEKLQVKLPEAEVQSFAVALRYMYTDCIFPLVKGEHLSFHRCVKSLENVCVLCANVTKRESRLKFTTKMTLRCG